MGFVRRLERSHWTGMRVSAVNRDPLSNFWYQPAGWLTSSGVRMSREAAMTLSAFWSGVQKIANSIASMPCLLYQHKDDGGKRQVAPNEPGIGRLALDLGRRPNTAQTAFDFFSMLVLHVLTRGLFVARIMDKPGSYGQQLLPLHPDRITAARLSDGSLLYDYAAPSGTVETYTQDEVFAVWGPTVDGVTPMSVIQYGARSIGTAIAAEQSSSSFFERGMTSQFAISFKDHLEPATAQQLSVSMAGQNAGLKNGHAPLILGDDPTIHADLGIKPQDAQLLATRQFGIEEVARWLDIPKHMLKADQGTGSYASMEVLSGEFVTYTLLPWLRRIEQSIGRDLIIAPNVYFAEFQMDILMRGNVLDRYKAHQIGIFSGFETQNEARAAEGRNPIAGLDQVLEPLNYVRIGDDAPAPSSPSKPTAPSTPGTAARTPTQARLAWFVSDSAARLVRREQHEVEKLAKKHAKDPAGWAQAVPAFYEEFASQIAEGLRISRASADEYAACHAMALVRQGVPAMAHWDPEAMQALTERAMTELAA